MRSTFPLLMSLLFPAALLAEEAAFTAKPAVTRNGDKFKIAFAVSAPTDVEVAILDAEGRVIRHLAAGVLGTNAPLPFKPGSLEQAIEWDGKDDAGRSTELTAGKPAAATSFKVRVRAGMKPEPDGFLLENPASSGPISSLAIGPKGSVYIFHKDPVDAHWGSTKIKILTRDGRHERAVMPFPAGIAPEKVKILGTMQTESGELVPRVHDTLRLNFYCDYTEPFWRAAAQCPAVDSRGRVYWLVAAMAIASLDADGGVPYDALCGPKLLPDIKGLNLDRPALALSSDEQFLYLSGLTTGDAKKKDSIKGVPCVFRVPVDKRGPAEPFLGKPDTPGTEKDLLSSPRGLAVAKGLIYVADGDADRIAVFSEKDKALVGEIKVKAPDSIGVDPASGAVYVCSVAKKTVPELIKFEGYATGKELLRLALPSYKYAAPSRGPRVRATSPMTACAANSTSRATSRSGTAWTRKPAKSPSSSARP